jgi:Tat protein secretion system quality control protein TatD with DNase activity
MIFETHAHYDDAKFDTDREMLLAELPQRGISPVINAGYSCASESVVFVVAMEDPTLITGEMPRCDKSASSISRSVSNFASS